MKYSIESLVQAIEKGDKVKYLMFWGHQKSKDGTVSASCFSQWWPCAFVVDNITYHTAEHWMMAQKALLFGDQQIFAKVISAKSPAEAKKLGRMVKNFNEKKWIENRFEIVVQGNWYKFSQHDDLKEFLIHTEDRVLVEASPVDSIWGIGLAVGNENAQHPSQWKGLNLLGFSLMEVRNMLNGIH